MTPRDPWHTMTDSQIAAEVAGRAFAIGRLDLGHAFGRTALRARLVEHRLHPAGDQPVSTPVFAAVPPPEQLPAGVDQPAAGGFFTDMTEVHQTGPINTAYAAAMSETSVMYHDGSERPEPPAATDQCRQKVKAGDHIIECALPIYLDGVGAWWHVDFRVEDHLALPGTTPNE